MKHNTCLYSAVVALQVALFLSPILHGKIVTSEFFNQATYGSEGPELTELEIGGRSIYLLKYLYKDKENFTKTLSKDEYLKIQKQMNSFFEKKNQMNDESVCERELVYTKVDKDNQVSNQILCWQDIKSEKRLQVSRWMSDMQRKIKPMKPMKIVKK